MPNVSLPAGARFLPLTQTLRPNVPNSIQGVDTGGLFSPLNPIAPLQPSNEYIRSRQIVPGENLIWQPKGDQVAGFWILRDFADSCDLLRMVITSILGRLASIPWELRLIAKAGEKVKDLQARQSNDPRIAKLTQLLRKPDGVHSYRDWTKMLWEDITVIDAGVIYKERDLKGRIANLRPIDGATFNVLVDEQGFQPKDPNPAHQQVLYGIPWFNFSTKSIVYVMNNPRTWKRYGFSAVEQIFITVGIGLQRQQFTSAYYTSGNIPEALCFLPSDLPIDRVKEVAELVRHRAGRRSRQASAIDLSSGLRQDERLVKAERNLSERAATERSARRMAFQDFLLPPWDVAGGDDFSKQPRDGATESRIRRRGRNASADAQA